MKKRITCLFALFVMLILQIPPAIAYESENILAMNTLFDCDFDLGMTASVGEFEAGSAYTVNQDERRFLRADSRNGKVSFYVYPEKWKECDSALVSFDVRTDSTTCRSYMDVFNATEDGSRPVADSKKMNRAWYITNGRTISFFQSFMPPSGGASGSTFLYLANIWYHFDMWIDYKTNFITYYVDGVDIGKQNFDETFTGIGGFRISVDQTGGGSSYDFDNIKVVSFPSRGAKIPLEGIAVPENFENPITIEYKRSDNRLGYIYPSKDVKLVATFENVFSEDKNVLIDTVITDSEDRILKEFSDEAAIDSKKEHKLTYSFNVERFGFYYVSTKVTDKKTGELFSELSFQFSVMNAPPKGVRNPKISFCDHSTDGQGYEEIDRKYELVSIVGASNIRTGFGVTSSCPGRGTDDFTITKEAMEQNTYASKYDLEQFVTLTFDKIPPVTDHEYARWEKYVEAIVLQHMEHRNPGKVTYYLVWNEYNGAGFNYIGATSSDYVQLLKHTYPIVKKLDPQSKVCGLVAAPTITPNDPQNAIDWVRDVFEMGGGEYMDIADIHPYNHTAPENTNSVRGRFIDETRALLDEFGYKDMPMTFSEMGWSTPGTVDEMGQGAYFVRWITMHYDQFTKVSLYVDQEKQTTSKHENGFGFTRAWTKKAAGENPPYSAKPAFLTLANYNTLMANATFTEQIEKTDNGDHIYKFKLRDGRDALIVWTTSGKDETLALKLGAGNATLYDMFGNDTQLTAKKDGEITFDISDMPVYLVGNFTEYEKCEPDFYNLSPLIETTVNDIAYIQFKNNSGEKVKLELDMSENIEETSRTDEQIDLKTGGNGVKNEKIFVKALNENGDCYYSYDIKVNYCDNVTYSLRPSYFRNGRWQCVMEIKNNKYTDAVSGQIVLKSPDAMSKVKSIYEFDKIAPRDVKLLRLNVPPELAGADMDLIADIILDNGEIYNDVSENVHLTSVALMKQPPVIDGELKATEWNKNIPLILNSEKQVVGIDNWGGKEDLSGKIYCAYDKDNFYLAAEVLDDVWGSHDDAKRAWYVDGLQFAFARDNVSSSAMTDYGIAMIDGEPVIDRYSFMGFMAGVIGEKDAKQFDGIEFIAVRNGNKTVYEAKFPWEQIYGEKIDVSKMKDVCFSILINENDGEGRKGWIEYAGGIGNGKNPGEFIRLTLNRK